MLTFLLLILQIILGAMSTDPDPCLEGNYGKLEDLRRSPNYVADPTETLLCDDQLISGWYRFMGGAMPESCIPVNKCGTEMPIWFSGKHPTVQDGILDMTLCLHYESEVQSGCCFFKFDTQVKNCSGFYVYYLEPVETCYTAYCAGDVNLCPSGQTGEFPNCTDLYPRLISLPRVEGPIIEGDDFYFYCIFNTTKYYDQQLFDVVWTVDNTQHPNGSITTNNTSCKFKGSLLEKDMNKEFGCKVKTYFKDTPNTTSDWTGSGNTYWAGIKIEPSTLIISEAEEELTASVITTVPIVCKSATNCPPFNLYLNKNATSKDTTSPKCKYTISPKDWNESTKQARVNIPIKAKRDHIVNKENRVMMLGFEVIQDFRIFINTTIKPIQVTVRDARDRYCNAWGDPHIFGMEFDEWRNYHLYNVGDYTLYENTERFFEVQVRTFVCNRHANGGIITCICGVAVREYNDVIRVDNCHNAIYGMWYRTSFHSIPSKTLRPATSFVISPDNRVFAIYLPSSTEVKVTQIYCSMTVDIIIPGTDKGFGRGICGTFDGIHNNEFVYRNQVQEDSCAMNDWGCNPTGFLESWRNEGKQSLFKGIPDPVNDDRTQEYCKCSNNAAFCYARGDISNIILPCENCKTPSSVIIAKDRKKRSVQSVDEAPIFPTYDPDQYKDMMPPKNMSWPTPSGITEQMAEEMCRNAIQSSQLWALCNTNITLDSNFLESCKIDIQVFDSHTAVEPFVNAFTTECQVKMATDPDNYIVNENGENVLKPEVRAAYATCSLECLRNGHCQQGQCVCNSSYTGSNCQLRKGVGPVLHYFYGTTSNVTTSECDIRLRPCAKIFMEVSNIELTESIKCKVYVLPSITETANLFPLYTTEEATFISSDMVACALPIEQIKPVRTKITVKISVTMDGSLYGNELELTISNTTYPASCVGIVHAKLYPTAIMALVIILVYYKDVFLEEIANV